MSQSDCYPHPGCAVKELVCIECGAEKGEPCRKRVHRHVWKPVGLDSWRCECGATRTAIV